MGSFCSRRADPPGITGWFVLQREICKATCPPASRRPPRTQQPSRDPRRRLLKRRFIAALFVHQRLRQRNFSSRYARAIPLCRCRAPAYCRPYRSPGSVAIRYSPATLSASSAALGRESPLSIILSPTAQSGSPFACTIKPPICGRTNGHFAPIAIGRARSPCRTSLALALRQTETSLGSFFFERYS